MIDRQAVHGRLAGGPTHGCGISWWIRVRAHGALSVQFAAHYLVPRRLAQKGWVEMECGGSENCRRARPYRLDRAGGRKSEK
jgi:hypothetical protein